MEDRSQSPITISELKDLLKAADSAVVLTPPRILRRIIKHDCKLTGIGLQVPHRKSYVIQRENLLQIADPSELELDPGRQLPPTVLLINQPDPVRLARLSRDEALLRYWRFLFHISVHAALEELLRAGKLTPAGIRLRIHRIGQTEFDEIRAVLRQENYLLPPRDDVTVYCEFVALYLELHYFARPLIPRYFPAIGAGSLVTELLAADLQGDHLFERTRLSGARFPTFQFPDQEKRDTVPSDVAVGGSASKPVSPARHATLLAAAQKAGTRRNAVRAAILCHRAGATPSLDLHAAALAQANAELDSLAQRLGKCLALSTEDAAACRAAMNELLAHASRGTWPLEARLLYDLQKVCVDHEKQIYSLDLADFLISFGQRPIRRLLPNHPALLAVKHLKGALHRLHEVRLQAAAKTRLTELFQHSIHVKEKELRAGLRPVLRDSLTAVGLQPKNLPEGLGRDKLIEELLDLAVERGFIGMGDLRDALSRNSLKLPDLSSPAEFIRGDPLILANRHLALALPGVYHRGEVYLRWLQRASSAIFGTTVGRFLTIFFILPFGTAFVALEGLQHMVNPLVEWLAEREYEFATPLNVGLLGAFIFGLLHSSRFRSGLGKILRAIGIAGYAALIRFPKYLLDLPVVRKIVGSRIFVLFLGYMVKPAAITAVLSPVLPLYDVRGSRARISISILYGVSTLLLNTRWGRKLEEAIVDALGRTWTRFRVDVFPALFDFIMQLFKSIIEVVERTIYTVDEWLRFRTGQSRLIMFGKTILGFLWFLLKYLVRIYVNLLIEPTINPIKHFPVVTVAAKIILPFVLILAHHMTEFLSPLGPVLSNALAIINITLLPGIFGFLVWEFKENWRLYQANRALNLRPAVIGHHGETLARLLKPGFHSGTIPKLFARLRRAERRSYSRKHRSKAEKYRDTLREVEERIRLFIEREFLSLLHESKQWAGKPIELGDVALGSNRVSIAFNATTADPTPAVFNFEERSGWLVAGMAKPGWLTQLSESQSGVWRMAMNGLFRLGKVDMSRDQVAAFFSPRSMAFDVLEDRLVVWPGKGFEVEVHYPFVEGKRLQPHLASGEPCDELQAIKASEMFLDRAPIYWSNWVRLWEADQSS